MRCKKWQSRIQKTILVIGAGWLLISCKQEPELPIDNSESKFKLSVVHGETLEKKNKIVWNMLSKFTRSNKESKNTEASNHDFVINTYTGLEIASPEFTSYTFEIHRDEPEEGFWENYVLTVYPDGDFIQYTVKYPILLEGGYDKENAVFTPINGKSLLERGGTCTDLQTGHTDVECQVVYCYTQGHENGNLIGTNKCLGNFNNPLETNCSVVVISDTTHSCFGGGDSIGSGGVSDTTGNSNSATNPTGYYSPANIVIRALRYKASSKEAQWLYSHSDEAVAFRNFLHDPTITGNKKTTVKEAITIFIELEEFESITKKTTFNALSTPWIKTLRDLQQRFESIKAHLPKFIVSKIINSFNFKLRIALTATAITLNPNVAKLNEQQKQAQLKSDGKKGVGILLFEFANGQGPDEREFFNGDAFWLDYFVGERIEQIKADFELQLSEEQKTFDEFVAAGEKIEGGNAFSPDHADAVDSFEQHMNANWVQFFVGGTRIEYRPTNQEGYIDVKVINPTSRYSLLLHSAKSYPRHIYGSIPLSTIKQHLYIRIKVR